MINYWLFYPMVKRFCLTKLHHHWSMSNNWWLFQGLDVHIPHCKYQVKPCSSWFLGVCAAAIVYRYHFFCLYQQNKCQSKVKLRQASNCRKSVIQTAKLAYANKTKQSITSQKLGSHIFGELLIVFSTKVNLLYLLYSTTQRCCLLNLVNQNCFLKAFLRTLIRMT